jgi:hypothetical protein
LKESGCALVHGLEVQLDEDGLLDEAERIALLGKNRRRVRWKSAAKRWA